MSPIRKYIDIPPMWLALFLGIAWLQKEYLYIRGLGWGIVDMLAGLLIGGGVVIALLALAEFRRHRTTFVPHESPTALLTSGVYTRSRNPIYIADILIFAGFVLLWDAWLCLALIPFLINILETRFIKPEEQRLALAFGPEFGRYREKVRRWV